MLDLDEAQVVPYAVDGEVPRVRLTRGEPPSVDVRLGGREYRYERSFPIKGHAAVMPRYLREQAAAGKDLLIIERPDRFYIYVAV